VIVGRLAVVALVVVAVGLAAWAHRRRTARDARDREGWPALPAPLRGEAAWVIFTTRYCATCRPVHAAISGAHPHDTVVEVDVADDPGLAERYGVRRAPTVLHADGAGTVLARLAGPEAVHGYLRERADQGRTHRLSRSP
jgi:hypothetical protein